MLPKVYSQDGRYKISALGSDNSPFDFLSRPTYLAPDFCIRSSRGKILEYSGTDAFTKQVKWWGIFISLNWEKTQGKYLNTIQFPKNEFQCHHQLSRDIWLTLFSSVQSLSHVRPFASPWTAARQASLSITNSWSLLKLMFIESVIPSNHLILCCALLLLPSIFPSIRVFSNESALRIRWPKYWSFSFSISPSNEHPGLIYFWMDWLDLLSVQGTLQSLIQHHSSKASVLRCSAFFMVQLSHPYMTTRKTTALTRWTFVDKVMSLLFNMLSMLAITFLPRSKCLLISWLQSPSAVILEPRKIKSGTVSTVSPSICHEVMGPDAMILVFWMLSFKPTFLLSSFSSRGSLVLHFLP